MHYLKSDVVKKIILIFIVVAFFVVVGCGKKYSNEKKSDIACPSDASCYAMPDDSIVISYNSLISLNEVITTLPSGYGILRTTSFELNKYSYETAFTEATVDVDFILNEYQKARNEFIDVHISIERNLYETHLQQEGFLTYAEAERTLVNDLTVILSSVPTPELKIKSVLAGRM